MTHWTEINVKIMTVCIWMVKINNKLIAVCCLTRKEHSYKVWYVRWQNYFLILYKGYRVSKIRLWYLKDEKKVLIHVFWAWVNIYFIRLLACLLVNGFDASQFASSFDRAPSMASLYSWELLLLKLLINLLNYLNNERH